MNRVRIDPMIANASLAIGVALVGLYLSAMVAKAEILSFETNEASFRIDTDTPALFGPPHGEAVRVLSLPAFDASTTDLVTSATHAGWVEAATDEA